MVNAEISIDFGTEIPHMTNDYNRGATTASPSDRPVNPITVSKADANIGGISIAMAGFKNLIRNKLGHITKKGWHTIKIKCVDSGTNGLRLHSLDFARLKDLLLNSNHGSWSSPSLDNGATHHANYPIEYRKNKANYTEIRGSFSLITGTVGTDIFTLPVGYRPDRDITLVCSNDMNYMKTQRKLQSIYQSVMKTNIIKFSI